MDGKYVAIRVPVSLTIVLLCTILSASSQPLQLVNAFPNLTFTQPVFLTHANDGTNRIFVVQQNGLIRVFPNDSAVTSATTFLNISSRISTGGERGLLGLAFHPNYATNGYFYVNYTQAGTGRTIVSRFRVDPNNPNQADPNSEVILLNIYQPYDNHNGGMIMFGLDGYLYIGMGDGGSAGDPGNRAQNLDSLLGKLLRIDVDNPAGGLNYGIPPDNPFVGLPGRDEIYALGLRNPWRFSQDPLTGEIWLADVGQSSWEEVDSIGRGRNYGWRCYEGPAAYNTSGCGPASQYTFPVKYYARVSPHCSVTGGYIYRGYRRPELIGRYIYGDYCSGYIWKFYYQNGVLSEDQLLIDAPFSISSFGVDQNGELYVCEYSTTGRIWRFAGNLTPTTTPVSPSNGSIDVPIPTSIVWRQGESAIRYWLEIATSPTFATIVYRDTSLTDTSTVVSSLSPGTIYYWHVRARNTLAWGVFSPTWSFTTVAIPPQVVLLSPPDSANIPSEQVELLWMRANGAATYRLEVAYDSLFIDLFHSDTALTDTVTSVSGLVRDTLYYWRVQGGNAAGWGAFSAYRRFRTTGLTVSVYGGWNMISLPVELPDRRKTQVFPSSVSSAFAFLGGGYTVRDTIDYGVGYWLKFSEPDTLQLIGRSRQLDTLQVTAGWNMIGSIGYPVAVQNIVQVPLGIVLSSYFGYTGSGYSVADTLYPAGGYWVKVSQDGQLILRRTASSDRKFLRSSQREKFRNSLE